MGVVTKSFRSIVHQLYCRCNTTIRHRNRGPRARDQQRRKRYRGEEYLLCGQRLLADGNLDEAKALSLAAQNRATRA